jgi:O-antigen/teichoic acid export membrane protein
MNRLRPGTGSHGDWTNADTNHTVSNDLKQRTVHGGLVVICTQAVTFLLRTASLVVLARLLTPEDFGLVAMVVAVTGFFNLLKDIGLSAVTVQSASITKAQMSTLFWINVGAGGILTILFAAFAPALAAFYREPRLTWVAVTLGVGFFLGGASAQHYAILQRRMRFSMLSSLEIASLVVGLAISIGMAAAGHGYWALVAMAISPQAVSALGMWLASGWVPGMPRRLAGTSVMLRFGGLATLSLLVMYIGRNTEKILLGRFWGAETLGIYGRGSQLIHLPSENLNDAIGVVAFPALSRVQNDPQRLRNYFLRGYGLFASLVMPVTMAGALFAEDIILVVLGPKWGEVAPVFRLLAPAVAIWGLLHPFGWLLWARGRVGTSLKIGLMVTPVVIVGYLAGLTHGPQGVAVGYSIAMLLMIVPVVLWSKHGTLITTRDTLRAAMHPSLSVLIGAVTTLAVSGLFAQLEPALLRLPLAIGLFLGVYLFSLLFVMRQKYVYINLFREVGLWPVASTTHGTARLLVPGK